ncbi:MAG: hypothetical protein GWP61_18430 [Chloroflexi bacterium]|jgi:lysine biosynthesis protein LysW|nr:hypothetical protein [Chloroflexota bacterium]
MPISRIDSLVAECPECSCDVMFEVMPRIGFVVTCAECGTKLEVAYVRPLMLDWVYDDDPLDSSDEYDDYNEYDD